MNALNNPTTIYLSFLALAGGLAIMLFMIRDLIKQIERIQDSHDSLYSHFLAHTELTKDLIDSMVDGNDDDNEPDDVVYDVVEQPEGVKVERCDAGKSRPQAWHTGIFDSRAKLEVFVLERRLKGWKVHKIAEKAGISDYLAYEIIKGRCRYTNEGNDAAACVAAA